VRKETRNSNCVFKFTFRGVQLLTRAYRSTPPEAEIVGDIAFISLSKNGIAIVDAAIADKVAQLPWHLKPSGYAAHNHSTRKPRGVLMHRYVLELCGVKIPTGMHVDHINRDRLDNRRDNLRVVTVSENLMNSSAWRRRRYKGVYPHSNGKPYWQAKICVGKGRTVYLGTFHSEVDAARAYNAAMHRYKRPGALNVIDG